MTKDRSSNMSSTLLDSISSKLQLELVGSSRRKRFTPTKVISGEKRRNRSISGNAENELCIDDADEVSGNATLYSSGKRSRLEERPPTDNTCIVNDGVPSNETESFPRQNVGMSEGYPAFVDYLTSPTDKAIDLSCRKSQPQTTMNNNDPHMPNFDEPLDLSVRKQEKKRLFPIPESCGRTPNWKVDERPHKQTAFFDDNRLSPQRALNSSTSASLSNSSWKSSNDSQNTVQPAQIFDSDALQSVCKPIIVNSFNVPAAGSIVMKNVDDASPSYPLTMSSVSNHSDLGHSNPGLPNFDRDQISDQKSGADVDPSACTPGMHSTFHLPGDTMECPLLDGAQPNVFSMFIRRYLSKNKCGMGDCINSHKEHYHCSSRACGYLKLLRKEDVARHFNYHKKQEQSLANGFRRFSVIDNCHLYYKDCKLNMRHTHYHCMQENCAKVYTSTSDVMAHRNFHKKNMAIIQDGFQRFTASEDCGEPTCIFYNERTTHFHCRRPGCLYSFKQKSDIEKHKTYHSKDLEYQREGFRKYSKHENCNMPECQLAYKSNHFHCLVSGCDFTFTAANQILSHKRKHDRRWCKNNNSTLIKCLAPMSLKTEDPESDTITPPLTIDEEPPSSPDNQLLSDETAGLLKLANFSIESENRHVEETDKISLFELKHPPVDFNTMKRLAESEDIKTFSELKKFCEEETFNFYPRFVECPAKKCKFFRHLEVHVHCTEKLCPFATSQVVECDRHLEFHKTNVKEEMDDQGYGEGWQCVKGIAACSYPTCEISLKRHYHCTKPGCYYVTINLRMFPAHKRRHLSSEIRCLDGFEHFPKKVDCQRDVCIYNRISAHYHCVRPFCSFSFQFYGQMETHSRKHARRLSTSSADHSAISEQQKNHQSNTSLDHDAETDPNRSSDPLERTSPNQVTSQSSSKIDPPAAPSIDGSCAATPTDLSRSREDLVRSNPTLLAQRFLQQSDTGQQLLEQTLQGSRPTPLAQGKLEINRGSECALDAAQGRCPLSGKHHFHCTVPTCNQGFASLLLMDFHRLEHNAQLRS